MYFYLFLAVSFLYYCHRCVTVHLHPDTFLSACLLRALGCMKQSQGVWTRVGLELLSQAGLSHLASGWKRRLALCQGWHHSIGKFNKSPWSGARSAQARLPLADFCSWTLSTPQLSTLCVTQDWGWVTALSSHHLCQAWGHGASSFRK